MTGQWEVPGFGIVKLSKAAEKMSKRQRLWSHQISEAVMQGTVEVEIVVQEKVPDDEDVGLGEAVEQGM